MNRLILILILAAATVIPTAARDKYEDPYKDYDEAVFMDMDFEQNLETPKIYSADKPAVKRYMNRLAKEYAAKHYTVDLLRDDEVMLITVPSDQIFLPNDTLLSPYSAKYLTPLLSLFNDPGMFKVVYGIHTDNTGTAYYNMQLSHRRNSSVYDWLLRNVSEDLIVIPFEFGDTDPVESNDTRKGRAANRRVEFYIIPGPKLLEMAHNKTLR